MSVETMELVKVGVTLTVDVEVGGARLEVCSSDSAMPLAEGPSVTVAEKAATLCGMLGLSAFDLVVQRDRVVLGETTIEMPKDENRDTEVALEAIGRAYSLASGLR